MDEREERLFQLLEKSIDINNETLKTNTELVTKISKSFDDVMIMIDKRSEKRDASNDIHINEWKQMSIVGILIVALAFVISIGIYFITPWESCTTSSSEATAISNIENKNENINTNDNNNVNKNYQNDSNETDIE